MRIVRFAGQLTHPLTGESERVEFVGELQELSPDVAGLRWQFRPDFGRAETFDPLSDPLDDPFPEERL